MKFFYILLVILLLIAILIGAYVFRFAIRRGRTPKETVTPPKENAPYCRKYYFQHKAEQLAWLETWGYEKVFIQNFRDARLAGYYFKAKKPTTRTVLAVHGYRSSGFNEYLFMAPMFLEELEMNLLIVDDYAHGNSQGKNIGFGYFDRLDVIAWCHWLKNRNPEVEILLEGISMGCATVLMTAGDENVPNNVVGVVADCGFSSLKKEMHYILTRLMKLTFTPFYQLGSLTCKLVAGYFFGDATPLDYVANIKVPVLFIHGAKDDYILPEHSEENFDACNSPKELVYVPEAPHAHSYLTNPGLYLQSVQSLINKIQWK